MKKIYGFGAFVILVIIILIVYFCTREDTGQQLEEGNFYTCGPRGCKKNRTGEHRTLHACTSRCRSFVKENGRCTEVTGIPWNSSATLESCQLVPNF